MEEQIERLKQQVRELRHRLIRIETDQFRAKIGAEDGGLEMAERNRCSMRHIALVAESAAVQAELTAAFAHLAHLNVAAEAERRAKQPSRVLLPIRENRERVEKFLEQHRKIARRMIRYATDASLIEARINGVDEKRLRERYRQEREQRREQKRKQQIKLKQDQGPKQQCRGLRL